MVGSTVAIGLCNSIQTASGPPAGSTGWMRSWRLHPLNQTSAACPSGMQHSGDHGRAEEEHRSNLAVSDEQDYAFLESRAPNPGPAAPLAKCSATSITCAASVRLSHRAPRVSVHRDAATLRGHAID